MGYDTLDVGLWGKYVIGGLLFFGKGPSKVELFDYTCLGVS